ncbi:MAG: helix-turn-helix domain-containing protein [Alphaproteobacteria bacterium]|nr:helix-turn-helix domain-containing protein [Alphaproteobacteria bacterium]
MPTLEQIRAARALLGWNQSDLAERAGLSQTGIARIENGTNHPNSQTLAKIEKAFDQVNIEFLGSNGVRKRSGEVRVFHGDDGLKEFLTDLYITAKELGGDICLHNAKPDNWIKWLGEDWFRMHSERMASLKDKISYKITCGEDDRNFISSSFAEYRHFPKGMASGQCIYAYAHKLAFVNFEEDDVMIRVLEDRAFADGFRVLFGIAWDNVAQPVQK